MLKYFFLFFFLSTHLLFADNKLMKYIPIDTEESLKRIQEGAIVIDVRYPNEHNKIRIENSHNIPFKEINIALEEGKQEEMLSKSNGKRTIPQIFFNNLHIGGYQELRDLEKKGELLNLVK